MKLIQSKLLFLFLSITGLINAQEPDYIDKIANDACDCVSELYESEEEITTTALGICLLKSAMPYKKQLLADYNYDLNEIDGPDGERIGVLIGTRMAVTCPDFLTMLSDEEEVETTEYQSTSGKIKSVNNDNFIVLEVTNTEGKTEKFYWLTFVASNVEDLQSEYEKLKNKMVVIEYIRQELFDPRLKEYRFLNVMTGLTISTD
ncbi:hypothetical protein [Robertkochia solimangrovi]|uniref:hypothetical protein n=1 Tax=Robertkochia solimangrovi TaxID=2213046 RepID=UPI00117F44E0|nr:hypothetical protein [Robertkochia solimangrovi]TRZ43182.1 hypothetical protein DMZ48_10845 [Robertkochia solimangrovi]